MTVTLPQILDCFPAITDWREAYLDDRRQRLLGEGEGFSVEIILGDSLDHVSIFSHSMERPEVRALVETFAGQSETGDLIWERAREFFRRKPGGTFHHILSAHTLTVFETGERVQLRISPSTEL